MKIFTSTLTLKNIVNTLIFHEHIGPLIDIWASYRAQALINLKPLELQQKYADTLTYNECNIHSKSF